MIEKYDRPIIGKEKILDIGPGNNPHREASHFMDIMVINMENWIKHDANIVPYPFESEQFTKIYMRHTLEHLEQSDDLIFRELYRLLVVGGKAFISVPNSLFIYHRLLYLTGNIPPDFVLTHRKHYSFKQLKMNLRNNGFKVFEFNNKWVFNPLRNYFHPHIKIVAKKIG